MINIYVKTLITSTNAKQSNVLDLYVHMISNIYTIQLVIFAPTMVHVMMVNVFVIVDTYQM